MRIITDAELLAKVHAFLAEHEEVTRARLGRETMNDPFLVQLLEKGRSLSLKNANKVLGFMAEYQPPEAADEQAAA